MKPLTSKRLFTVTHDTSTRGRRRERRVIRHLLENLANISPERAAVWKKRLRYGSKRHNL